MAEVIIGNLHSDASDLVNLVLERALVFGCWNWDAGSEAESDTTSQDKTTTAAVTATFVLK